MNGVLDLSRGVCHVCRHPLTRNFVEEKERCTNEDCQIYLVTFSIPYVVDKTRKAG